MKITNVERLPAVSLITIACLVLVCSVTAAGQGGVRPSGDSSLDRRLEAEKSLRDNERLRRGMEADSEVRAKSKEERRTVANEAFVRLKALHNEILSLTMTNEKADPNRVAELVTEARKRAIELRANLDLPLASKEKSKEEEKTTGVEINDSLTVLCDHIRSFVINLNESPTNNKAAEQARRELDALVELSDKIVPPKKNGP